MSRDAGITNSIQEYLAEHFPNATTEEWQHEKQESINFKIHENDKIYVLRVMDECTRDLQANEVKTMLENFNVAQVMRDIGDFPIVVTNSGCIFGSP